MSQKQLRKLRELRQEVQGVPENREVPMEPCWAPFGDGFWKQKHGSDLVVNWNIMSIKL